MIHLAEKSSISDNNILLTCLRCRKSVGVTEMLSRMAS